MLYIFGIYRSSHQRCSRKKSALTNLANLKENICVGVPFLIKLQVRDQSPATLLKKESLAQVFSCRFCRFCTSTFFMEHHWVTASGYELVIFDLFE